MRLLSEAVAREGEVSGARKILHQPHPHPTLKCTPSLPAQEEVETGLWFLRATEPCLFRFFVNPSILVHPLISFPIHRFSRYPSLRSLFLCSLAAFFAFFFPHYFYLLLASFISLPSLVRSSSVPFSC